MNTLCENSESAQENICLEWADVNKQIRDRPSDSEETTIFEPDYDSKIKPEVELKEDTDNFVYKADFSGHLQLVNISHGICNHSSSVENAQQGNELTKQSVESYAPKEPGHLNQKCNADPTTHWPEMKSEMHSTSGGSQQVVITWQDQSNNDPVYRHLKSMSDGSVTDGCFIKEEPSENSPHDCSYIHSLPEIYDYSSDSTWDPQTDSSSQLTRISSSLTLAGNMILTQAEKKRLYRMRIKEENPALWSTLKKREAARKREQREKRRNVIFEMQKAMEQATQPDSPDGVNHRMYLEALKERYPELWSQLMNALPATQMRNDQLYNERNTKSRRNVPKQAKMYRDVIEAQKKRLYRQRIKEEHPEMYARQKARDAYSRSVQRHLLKKRAQKIGFRGESEKNGPNADAADSPVSEADVTSTNAPSEIPSADVPPVPAKSVPSQVCDNSPSEDVYTFKESPTSSDSNISEFGVTKHAHQAFSTQSSVLWLWNDLRGTGSEHASVPHCSPWRKEVGVLTKEERLHEILGERAHLRERRRHHRRSITPEKRTEFLEAERMKVYRTKAENMLQD